ncbi:hypothetical protein Sjap_018823 [Stephania japonica]|uniref:Uncharacterized protein n=1 Tax=Stephania japonica TaxID=461633 RepID=A0AAP0I8Y8_9MAGN
MNGGIDCYDLKVKLRQNEKKPEIVIVNIGSTVNGANDNIDCVIQTLKDSGFDHNRFCIHCDCSISGLMVPFIKADAEKVTFKKPIGSVSTSC